MKTLHKRSPLNKTRKNRGHTFMHKFITSALEALMMIKLYHWKTHSFATHKATDELYSSLNDHMDQFVEVLMGKLEGTRANFMSTNKIHLIDLNNKKQLIHKVNNMIGMLSFMEQMDFIKSMPNTDLLNIRDEVLADLNQFLYLLSLK